MATLHRETLSPLIGVTQKNLNIDMGLTCLSTRRNAFFVSKVSHYLAGGSKLGRWFPHQDYLMRGLISHQTGLNDIINDCNNPDK